jgi:preprotein translocase subunit SecY
MNVGIRGVVPGETTEHHVGDLLLRTKFWGGLALGALAVTAMVFDLGCRQYIGTTLGTTSLLIIVGAVLQTSRQVCCAC